MTARRSKYHAIPTELDGIRFPSMGEANRYAELKVLQSAGQISGLEVHPVFPIIIEGAPLRIRAKNGVGRKIVAEMDFSYVENGQRVIEDFKGKDNPYSRIKRALVEHIYRVTVRVTGAAA